MITERSYTSSDGNSLSSDERSQLFILITTPAGTVALDREFGLDQSYIDMPIPIAQNMCASELAEKIDKYIPTLRLSEVILTEADANGNMTQRVVVEHVE